MNKLFLIFFLLVISCKTEKSTNKNHLGNFESSIEDNNIPFKVFIEGYFDIDDYILLFYKDAPDMPFDNKHKVIRSFKGSKKMQSLDLVIPEGELLYDFSLHISDKIGQKIEINKIVFQLGSEKINISKDSLSFYLRPNEYIDMNYDTGDFDLITVKKNGVEGYNPIFKGEAVLIDKLMFL